MPSKTEEYLALAQRTANGLTRYWEHWTDYLTTASRLYKYSFADQLMIYAQRPDATACASFDIWNNRMNRYVRRGSKGIALLDQSSSVPRLHYVFDVSDTGVRRNSRDPEVWQLNDDLFQPVSEMLAREYGIHHERLSQQIADIAGKLAESYWDNNSSDILGIVDGSFLMDYDEAGQELQFKSAAAISIMYTILERCGFEPEGYFDRDDFQAIYDFSTPDAVYALGAAVSDCSRDVLRNIERTVKTTIRRRNVERSQHEYDEQERDLLDRRGLPAPEPDLEPAAEAAGPVRTDAPDVPDGESPGAVQLDAADREAASAPAGSGAGSGEPEAADDDRTAEAEPSPGQSEEPTDVGATHEQPESTGGRSDPDGTDVQAAQIQYVNSVIMGMAQYLQTSICSHAYHAIDRRVNNAALTVWKKLYPKRYNSMQVPLKVLCNLPDRHKGYDSKTFAVWVEGKWFGITYAFITHSHYEPKPFDQKMTPYTVEGRRRYVNYRAKHKSLPCDRPSVNSPNDIAMSAYAKGRMNFEYYMNREYAYSRDKGKCKCCGNAFSPMLQKHCHHVKNKLPLDRINKVPNLVWLCEPCHRMVHNSPIPPELDAKTVGKIMKYREKLKL